MSMRYRPLLATAFLLGIVFVLAANGGCPDSSPPLVVRGEDDVVLLAEYVGWACGEDVPQILPLNGQPGLPDASTIRYGLEFYVPDGVPAPDQMWEICLPGNRFELHGYPYFEIVDGEKVFRERFDLLGWQLILPAEHVDENGEIGEVNSAANYKFSSDCEPCPETAFIVANGYQECD